MRSSSARSSSRTFDAFRSARLASTVAARSARSCKRPRATAAWRASKASNAQCSSSSWPFRPVDVSVDDAEKTSVPTAKGATRHERCAARVGALRVRGEDALERGARRLVDPRRKRVGNNTPASLPARHSRASERAARRGFDRQQDGTRAEEPRDFGDGDAVAQRPRPRRMGAARPGASAAASNIAGRAPQRARAEGAAAVCKPLFSSNPPAYPFCSEQQRRSIECGVLIVRRFGRKTGRSLQAGPRKKRQIVGAALRQVKKSQAGIRSSFATRSSLDHPFASRRRSTARSSVS